jgi:hypothetical protein
VFENTPKFDAMELARLKGMVEIMKIFNCDTIEFDWINKM